MGRKGKTSKENKIKACEEYLLGKKSMAQLSNDLGVTLNTISRWINSFVAHGASIFDFKPRNKTYSKELKLQAVKEYLGGGASLKSIAIKYNILSSSIVYGWVKLYNSGIDLQDYNPKGEVYTMKVRKTTFEERLEIVRFVLGSNKDYKQAAIKYLLPYSLIYNWTKKYLSYGEEGLKYQKKGPKSKDFIPENLSEQERLIRENKFLKDKIGYLELEAKVLKKKAEFERQIESQKLGKKKSI